LGLQDRITVIADKLLAGGAPAGLRSYAHARFVQHRARSRCGRFEAGKGWVSPYAGEIWGGPRTLVRLLRERRRREHGYGCGRGDDDRSHDGFPHKACVKLAEIPH